MRRWPTHYRVGQEPYGAGLARTRCGLRVELTTKRTTADRALVTCSNCLRWLADDDFAPAGRPTKVYR